MFEIVIMRGNLPSRTIPMPSVRVAELWLRGMGFTHKWGYSWAAPEIGVTAVIADRRRLPWPADVVTLYKVDA